MKNTNVAIKEIQNLIIANYERMVAFEQASFNAGSPSLQQYFEDRAAESEMNITELNEVLTSLTGNVFDFEKASQQNLLGTSQLFTGQKNINRLLKHLQYLEKAVIRWYKTGMKNLKGFSQAMTQLLSKQYTGLEASHVYVKSC
jgi:ferritin-like metal-binding protein YciE